VAPTNRRTLSTRSNLKNDGMEKVALMGLFFFPLLVSVLSVKDIFEQKNFANNVKLMWIAVVILIPLVGAIIYFFFGKPKSL
jgi:putative effector of murein hydrolase LrgA (UPF0299 family)